MKVSASDGKYTIIQNDDYSVEVLRHGEPWPAFEHNKPDNLHMALAHDLYELRKQVRELFQVARDEGLWIGMGRDGKKPFTDEAQYGPKAKALIAVIQEKR